MSKKNLKKFTQDELEQMQMAIDEVSEEDLQEIVGAGGDINPETTYRCVATGILTALKSIRPFVNNF
ncbi:class II lanthipeptide, LchA2/BrtA2 family [Enterococcus rivorum]|uniref:class II lanthipeptide, LchA2/BrtA2 family n=1 Tax=Enterococcus rivorum TaxID=762845 RepID=UPI00362F2CB9